jgi:hypothetical protein
MSDRSGAGPWILRARLCSGVLPDLSRGAAAIKAGRLFTDHGLLRRRPSTLSGPGPLATSNKNPPAIETFLRKWII